MLRNVDFSENSNLLIIACSVSLGLGATVVPDLFHVLPPMLRILVNDGIICGSLCAIILNLLLPKKDRVRAPSDIPVRVVDPALKEG
ncbi:hypothetical protein ABRY64_03475 [Heyndrickxia faecalis]